MFCSVVMDYRNREIEEFLVTQFISSVRCKLCHNKICSESLKLDKVNQIYYFSCNFAFREKSV